MICNTPNESLKLVIAENKTTITTPPVTTTENDAAIRSSNSMEDKDEQDHRYLSGTFQKIYVSFDH